MAYNIRNYWVVGLCPWCNITKSRKQNVSETGSFSSSGEGGRQLLLRLLERADLSYWAVLVNLTAA
jgi:hypothetical protein